MTLPPRQRDALDAILGFTAGAGRTPTFRELVAVLGVSLHAVACLVGKLRVAGALTWDRRITVARPGAPSSPPPVAARIGGVRRVVGFGVS